MKNFSAKNAEFETLKINNEAAISSADLGTAPNQIPLNKDLGSLAYQDAVNLDDVSADMLELRAIAAEISDSAVDVFVYDTSRDSDGGAWRKRTQHTSWYNEELNTATRGGRREFPAVAVIVAEANKVTIYDGDDPDLSMWMVFEQISWGSIIFSCVTFINGKLVIGSGSGYTDICFIKERMSKIHPAADYTGDYIWNELLYNPPVVVERPGLGILHNVINDVAMTILPNAPIDEDTGLPVPTIAVATNGGVSVIKDDGTVVDIVPTTIIHDIPRNIKFTNSHELYYSGGNNYDNSDRWFHIGPIPSSDISQVYDATTPSLNTGYRRYGAGDEFPNRRNGSQLFLPYDNESPRTGSVLSVTKDYLVAAGKGETDNGGVGYIAENLSSPTNGMVAYITNNYNTGWMPGDIKLATLSDTTVETIGVNSDELVTNGGFNSDYTGWVGEDASLTNANHPDSGSNSLLVTPTALPAPGKAKQDLATVSGQRYVLSASIAFGAGCTKISILDNSGGIINEDYFPGDGNRTITIYVNGDVVMSELRLVAYGGPAYFDNISVRATTELITNGDFSNGTTGWTAQEDNGTFTASNGVATIAYVTGPTSYEQYVTTVIGKTYTLSFDITAISTSQPQFYYNTGSGDVGMAGMDDTGVKTSTFVANSTSTRIWVRCPFEGSFDIDNISVRPAEEDRSVNNNGLQIVGEINKTPVAPGADLVAYSGFSANDYLVQPYNEDLDFGTGDFYISSWFKTQAGSGYDDILAIGLIGEVSYPNWLDGGILVQLNLNLKQIQTYLSNPVYPPHKELPVIDYNPGVWNQLTIVRRTGYVTLYLNGKQSSDSVEYLHDFKRSNDPKWRLKIGYSGDEQNFPADNSSLALFKISATAPTADQIAKIYRDEKALFQDGVQATLYGTSDAVTALAYDDSNQLLHVGTASGRSDFRGLARINNTTTAISNSISAAEGTIIQN